MAKTGWLLAGLLLACGGEHRPAAGPSNPETSKAALPATASKDEITVVVPPCTLPAEIGIALHQGRVFLNGAKTVVFR